MAILVSCSFLAEKTGQVLDGSAFMEKKLPGSPPYYGTEMELRRILFMGGDSSDGNDSNGGGFIEGFVLTLKKWPDLKFYLVPLRDDSTKLYLHSCHFFCSGISGWNEFILDLSGNGEFNPPVLKLEHIEPITISWGRIRDGDTRISGEDALPVLRNRWERFLALTEWMHGEIEKDGAENPKSFADLENFENYWKPLLLPETVQKRKQPGDYAALASLGQWSRGEDMKWNSAYTAAHFPEELGKLRDQGAFLRDWEEALPWLYLVYEWDNVVQHISLNTFDLKGK
jgi:hypothetical protein